MDPDRFRRQFLARIGDFAPFRQIVDLLPDISLFVKDRQGRFVLQNRRAYEACRVATELETIGRTDHDFFPPAHAALYVAGDQQVFASGQPLINLIEPAPDSPSGDAFIVCSKYPLRDRQQRIIGVVCMYRSIECGRHQPAHFGKLRRAVDVIHQRYAEPWEIAQLAKLSGLSRSQFSAHFRTLFQTTPHDYLTQVRITAALRLLAESTQPITSIALTVGFYDHSHFSRTFHKLMGISPLTYRRRRTG